MMHSLVDVTLIREDALLQVVSQLLPLPHLRCGFLLAADPERRAAVDEAWASCWFVLDHVSLRTASVQHRGGAGECILAELISPVSSTGSRDSTRQQVDGCQLRQVHALARLTTAA